MTTEYWKRMVEVARKYPMDQLIAEQGLTVIPYGRDKKTTAEHDSLVIFIKDNSYYRYSTKKGGSTIDYLINECDMDYKSAVRYLAARMGIYNNQRKKPTTKNYGHNVHNFYGETKQKPQEQPVAFVLPQKAENNKRVYAYLSSRGISGELIHDFIHKGLLYQSADTNNCVFVGRDGSGNGKAGYLRGTYTFADKPFKGNVPGSDKSYGVLYEGVPGTKTVFCVEAPIDMMSLIELFKDDQKVQTAHKLALCGVDDTALQRFLKEHHDVEQIIFCLDKDNAGIEATVQYLYKYGGKYSVGSRSPSEGKDWNEYHMAKKEKERGAGGFSALYEKLNNDISSRTKMKNEQKYAPER